MTFHSCDRHFLGPIDDCTAQHMIPRPGIPGSNPASAANFQANISAAFYSASAIPHNGITFSLATASLLPQKDLGEIPIIPSDPLTYPTLWIIWHSHC